MKCEMWLRWIIAVNMALGLSQSCPQYLYTLCFIDLVNSKGVWKKNNTRGNNGILSSEIIDYTQKALYRQSKPTIHIHLPHHLFKEINNIYIPDVVMLAVYFLFTCIFGRHCA